MDIRSVHHSVLSRSRFFGFCAVLLLLFTDAAALTGAGLEEKMKYERSLEQKVEDVLSNLLGPGKSRVMIRATVDFSTKENLQVKDNKPPETDFAWKGAPDDAGGKEILPGFLDDSAPAAGAGGNYQREIIFPQALIKRLTVSLVLSDTIPEAEALKVRQVVSDLLALDQARGDDLLLMRASFAPIWYTSEMLGTLVKYGIIAVIAIFGMGIVAVGFLKMASAMNSMGGMDAGTKISMEMAGGGGNVPDGSLKLEDFSGVGTKAREAEGSRENPSEGIIFDIKADKLEILVRMLAKDAPEDIALIAVHLPQGLRNNFLSLLPPEMAPEVLASIAKVRFVEPEMITRIKDELERRLNGAVGGYGKAVELIEGSAMKVRMGMISALEKSHPEVAAAVRQRIFMMDDLDFLEENDFAILSGAAAVETWALAYWRMTETGREKLKKQLPERAWKVLEQAISYGMPADDKIDAAADHVLGAAVRLMAEGRIKRPAGKSNISLPVPSQVTDPGQTSFPATDGIKDYGPR